MSFVRLELGGDAKGKRTKTSKQRRKTTAAMNLTDLGIRQITSAKTLALEQKEAKNKKKPKHCSFKNCTNNSNTSRLTALPQHKNLECTNKKWAQNAALNNKARALSLAALGIT